MACHVKITCHNKFYFFYFVKKKVSTSLAMTYMFVYCIYTIYIDACIHQSLNPRPHGSTCTTVLTTKTLQSFINKKEKIKLLCLAWNYLGNSNFYNFFFKIYSNATNENMMLKFTQ